MTTTDELARSWARDRQAAPTAAVLALATRRICACGRLATVAPLLHVDGIVRTRVLEHGGAAHVAPGCTLAEVWVRAPDDIAAQRIAGAIHRGASEWSSASRSVLLVAVHRARWWDLARGWLRWVAWRE